MCDYISREAFLEKERRLYCQDCSRRKNSKGKIVYEIGDAPCRACGIGDVLDDLEDIPAADAIEELSKRMDESIPKSDAEIIIEELSKPRWIPVSERKPNTDDIVIVAIHDDSGDTPYDVTNVGFYLDVFPLGIWVVENEICNYVTHWMPLPEPPKEGET